MPFEEEEIRCKCDRRGENEVRWAFCEDDRHCPRCGERITVLEADDQRIAARPNDRRSVLWIYPRKLPGFDSPQYAFPLKVIHADRGRRRCERAPTVDIENSRGPAPWFSHKIEAVAHGGGGRFYCRLVPASSAQPPQLPSDGLDSILHLEGDFGRYEFRVRICNAPVVEVDLQGRGIERVDDRHWQITLAEQLELDLTVRAVTAPILIDEPLDRIDIAQADAQGLKSVDPGLTASLSEPLPKGTEITPASPWSTRLWLDATRLSEPGQVRQMLISLKAAVYRLSPLVLKLERIQKGKLEFWPSPITVDVMYDGEVRSNAEDENPESPRDPPVIRKVFVTNVGEETIKLQPLEVRSQEPTATADWITVRWAVDVDEPTQKPKRDGTLVLEPGERGEVYIRVDLTSFRGQTIPAEGSLTAQIRTEDDTRTPWTVEFRILHLLLRTESPDPLAIDFGNSNSYAAIRNPGPPYPARRGAAIVPAHELRDPERSPTALFLKDIGSMPKSSRPEYVIGKEAVALAGESDKLVTDLKRWIGPGSDHKFRLITDQHGNTRRFNIDQLVQFYLEELIRQTERVLRKHHVTRIGVSYPAKFCPQRRKAFQEIIQKLCDDSSQDPGRRVPITAAEFDIDEANAVAVGFAFNVDDQEKYLEPLVSPERPSFVVASFDLGGGSLDTALLRFHVQEGDIEEPVFESTYLGIGGHEDFGGDNVTLAFLELLKERLRAVVQQANQPTEHLLEQIPSPIQRDQTPRTRRTFHAMFTAAEAIKLFQCTHSQGEVSAADRENLKRKLQLNLINALDLAALDANRSEQVRKTIEESIETDAFLISLDEAYDHVLQCDFTGQGDYSVRSRIVEAVLELRNFAETHEAGPIDFVVLGGSGSRLPLVKQIVAEELSEATPIYEATRLKFRVAEGLVRHLDLVPPHPHKLARSRDYTSREIGILRNPTAARMRIVVPNCSRLNDPGTWHEFRTGGERLANVVRYLVGGTRLELHRASNTPFPDLHGWFDLSVPGQESGVPGSADLPSQLPHPLPGIMHAAFRLLGSETEVELRIEINGEYYGYWKMIADAPPPS
jgi:molecular chaperone DnaK (HSP70)